MHRPILLAVSAALVIARTLGAEPASFAVEPAMVGVEDAFPVAVGRTEVEGRYRYSTAARAFDVDGDTFSRGGNGLHVGALTVKHGFTESLDAAIGIFGAYARDEDEPEGSFGGLGDLFVNVKWHFLGKGEDGLHLAYLPGLLIPIGEQDDDKLLSTGLGHWTLDQTLVATAIRGRWVGGADASFFLPFGDRNGARGFAIANLGAGYQLTPWFKPELELNYGYHVVHDADDRQVLAATAGAIFNLSNALRADLGLRHGLVGRNADRRFSVILSLLWTF
jgi:hypothetical protein